MTKGFAFSLSGSADPLAILRRGLHGTYHSGLDKRASTPSWSWQMLETFADYASMEGGDRVFFFKNRKIFGIAEIHGIRGEPAALLNYSGADLPRPPRTEPSSALLGPVVGPDWHNIRLVVPFGPSPHYFSRGIDMDELLGSPDARSAWGLRFWQGKSFQQLGVRETEMLTGAFLRRFYNEPGGFAGHVETPIPHSLDREQVEVYSVGRMVAKSPSLYVTGSRLRHEAVLHGLLVESLRDAQPDDLLYDPDRLHVFHELAASPPKPPKYADHIDIVGTRGVAASSTALHYDLFESKKDRISESYDATISQLMKYVDFMTSNYADGNYAAVSAFFVAAGFSRTFLDTHRRAIDEMAGVASRSYVLDPHDSTPTKVWSRVRLLEYQWDQQASRLLLAEPDLASP